MPRFILRDGVEAVDAVRIDRLISVRTPTGIVLGHPGDWLIINTKGEQFICPHHIFLSTYQPIDRYGRNYLKAAVSPSFVEPDW